MRVMRSRGYVAAAVGLLAGLASSYAPDGLAGPTSIDMIEHMFGASNTNAVAGHGGLTIGVSPDGDLTVVSWPSPSYTDQIAYIASNALDVRAQPHLGAVDGMGSYVGLFVQSASGTELTWLRDWEHTQTYSNDLSAVPVTTFTRSDLGLSVVLTDIVSPDVDVLTRNVAVTRESDSAVTAAKLVLYENLSPSLSKIPELPIADWALDSRNDFLAVYDRDASAIIHFHPGDRHVINSVLKAAGNGDGDFGAIEDLLEQANPSDEDIDAFVATIDTAYEPGVAVMVTTEPPPTAFQVGGDATPLCAKVDEFADNIIALPEAFPGVPPPMDLNVASVLRCEDALPTIQQEHAWQWRPEDALSDLSNGELSSSRISAAQTNGVLATPLEFIDNVATANVTMAFGATVGEARTALAAATAQSTDDRLAAAEAATHDALGGAALPDPALGERVMRVAKRALVNLYVGRDREVGAIVASVARQPPYYLDWPRDGAFFSAALDVAGLEPWVTQRAHWMATLARQQPTRGNFLLTPDVPIDPDTGAEEFPAFAWEMNYFADGTTGGPIRFEIDNTALHIWSLALHTAHLDESKRADFVEALWPSTRAALELLHRWRDETTGLPALANEDDNPELTSGLHSASTVYTAMVSGARLAMVIGETADAERYLRAANELKAATLKHYYDESKGLLIPGAGREPSPGSGPSAWSVWPARMFARDDPRLESQLASDMGSVMPKLRGELEGGVYTAKPILSAALYGLDDGAKQQARDALQLLAAAATPDTLHFGEVYVTSSKIGPTWSNRVAPPHIWEGILFYLAAMALTNAEPFNADARELALPVLPNDAASGSEGEGGCGCRIAAPRDDPAFALGSALLLAFTALRRRRRAASR